jgi:hypothetical protein
VQIVQEELVKSQFQEYVQEQRTCTQSGIFRTLKNYHIAHFKSLFGGVSLRVPRLNGCSCEGQDNRTQTVKIDGQFHCVSREFEFLQSKLATMIPYARTADLLDWYPGFAGGNQLYHVAT